MVNLLNALEENGNVSLPLVMYTFSIPHVEQCFFSVKLFEFNKFDNIQFSR